MALTDAVVRQAKTTGKDYTLNDTDGLVLFVTARGAKKWHFRFTWLGKQQRVAVGSYPEMSLKEAREQRDDLERRLPVALIRVFTVCRSKRRSWPPP